MLTLATPYWLLALPLPWIVWRLSRRPRRSSPAPRRALLHPQTALLARLQAETAGGGKHIPWLWLLGCGLLILALSRPQWQTHEYQGRNFLLALDVSGSMRALDFSLEGRAVSRMEMLKTVVEHFIDSRRGDRIGLVIFADDAFTLAPLTTDLNLLRRMMRDVGNGIAGEKTALGDAIALGVKRLQREEAGSRILILLTDGSNTSGRISPALALTMAQHEQVKIYAVGLGSQGKVLFPRGPRSKPDYKRVPMDEALLQQLATGSGGRYYRATATEELSRIINDIEQLETVAIKPDLQPPAREWYLLPFLAGLLLLTTARIRSLREVAP